MTMYELSDTWRQLLEMGDDPTIDADAISDTMEAVECEIEEKAENVAKVLAEMTAVMNGLKEEEERLHQKRMDIDKKKQSLKKRLQELMECTGKTSFKTKLFSFSIQKNGGKIPVIVDVDTSELPDDMVMISEKPDTEALRKYIEEHGECKYAHFGERGESLRIK